MIACAVQEIQGLYGPFTLSERVIQKIWLRRDFVVAEATTESGLQLEVLDPGRWNLQDGPDFKEARLVIAGREVQGDVEIHFNEADWRLHDHQNNPNFDRVVLHVVLYPRRDTVPMARTLSGTVPEVLVLLPLLEHDLESYAMDEALREMEQMDELEWMVEFLSRPLLECQQMLENEAQLRWAHKLDFARKRLKQGSWSEVCHQMCLEVLGYARNRVPMARLALRHPLCEFQAGQLSTDALFAEFKGDWRLNGLRPANHPRRRLEQYLAVVRRQPDWPQRLSEVFKIRPREIGALGTRSFRKTYALRELQRLIGEVVFAGQIGSGKLNTLICDALLPLVTAAGVFEGAVHWSHWYPGDAPDALRKFLKHAQITDFKNPQSNGSNQGALALFLRRGGKT
ncbi:MAG: hypothetical protein ACI81V_000881 [Lentimonas sp.]|jgi:hypothetical protein